MNVVTVGGLVVTILVVTAGIKGTSVIPEYQRLVVFRLGNCIGARGPGATFVLPILERAILVDMRERFHEVSHEACITKDNAKIDVDFLFYWKVEQPVWSQTRVQNLEASLEGLVTGLLRAVIGMFTIDEVLAQREKINGKLKDEIDDVSTHWGVYVTTVEIREVVLPNDIQNAMHRLWAADRERRARILEAEGQREIAIARAEGEAMALERLYRAASTLSDGDVSLIERFLTIAEKAHLAISKDIFIVHGHDEATKESVSRFVEKLGLRAIMLHEQPDAGRTIVEKFEAYSKVGFAIILLTPDDVSSSPDKSAEIKRRARQNVILELGYFMGKLGRQRVCALFREGVEIPSDYQGILYIPLDPGGAWRLLLAREIKHAGIEIDLSSAY